MKINNINDTNVRNALRKRSFRSHHQPRQGQTGVESFTDQIEHCDDASSYGSDSQSVDESEAVTSAVTPPSVSDVSGITTPLAAVITAQQDITRDPTDSRREIPKQEAVTETLQLGINVVASLRQLQEQIFNNTINDESLNTLRQLENLCHSDRLDPQAQTMIKTIQTRLAVALEQSSHHLKDRASSPTPTLHDK